MDFINIFNKYKFYLIIVLFFLWLVEEKLLQDMIIFKYLFVLLAYMLAWIPIIEIKITGRNKDKFNLYSLSALIVTIMVTGFVFEQ